MKKKFLFFVSLSFVLVPVFFAQGAVMLDVNRREIILSPIEKVLPIKLLEDEPSVGVLATTTVSDGTDVPDINEADCLDRECDNTEVDTENVEDLPTTNTREPELIDQEYPDRGDTLIINKEEISLPVSKEGVTEKSPVIVPEKEETDKNFDKIIVESNKPLTDVVEVINEIDLTEIDFTKIDVGAVLDVCNLQNGCSGDVGSTHWIEEASVFYNDYRREIKFHTKENKYTQGILQVSNFSFEEFPDAKIIHSQGISTGVTLLDFSIFSKSKESEMVFGDALVSRIEVAEEKVSQEEKQGFFEKTKKIFFSFFTKIKNITLKPIQLVKSVFVKEDIKISENSLFDIENIKFNTYYLRVIPTEKGKVIGQASNQIKVSLKHPEEATEITIYKPAKLYEVKIKSFDPIRAPEAGICNGAMILENDWTTLGVNGPVTYKAGERVCPKSYKGVGEEAWYESLWNFAKSGVNWVTESYQKLKKAVVDGLADVACGGDDYCRQAISAGLDIGLAAMGIPPSLPNFDELVDGGLDYLAGEIALQAGCFDPECKEKIKQGLELVLEENKNSNPYCKGKEEANRMGFEPLCLPDNVKAHLDPLATYRQAKIVLEVKRTNLDGSNLMDAPYRLHFNNYGHNSAPVGSWIHNIQPYGASVQITKPLEGIMFETKTMVLPEMEKGSTMEIPIVLTPEEYWVPGHKEAMEGWTTVTFVDGWPQYQYDDWWKLYYGGNLSLGAVIDGCDYNIGSDGCVVSSDFMSVVLPNGLNP